MLLLGRFEAEPADAKRGAKQRRNDSGCLVDRFLCPGDLRRDGFG